MNFSHDHHHFDYGLGRGETRPARRIDVEARRREELDFARIAADPARHGVSALTLVGAVFAAILLGVLAAMM